MGWYDWLQKRAKWVEEKLDPTPGNRIANWSFNTVDPWAKRNIINPVSGYLGDAMAKSNERWQGAYGQLTTPQGRKLWSEQFTGGAGASNRNVRAREAELGRKLTREEKLGWTQDYLAGRKTRAQEAWQAAPGPSYHMGWMPSWSPVKQVGVKGAWEAVNPELGGGAIGAGEAVGAVGARLGGNAARSLSYGMRGEGLLAPAERIAGAAASRGIGGAVERAGLRITALEELPGRALGSAFRRGGTELRPTGALDNVTMNSPAGAMDNVSFANAAEDAGIPHGTGGFSKSRLKEKGGFIPTDADDVVIDSVVEKMKRGATDWTPDELQAHLNWKNNIEARLKPAGGLAQPPKTVQNVAPEASTIGQPPIVPPRATTGASNAIPPVSPGWLQMEGNKFLLPMRSIAQKVATEIPDDILAKIAHSNKYAKGIIGRIDPRRAAVTDIEKWANQAYGGIKMDADELSKHAVSGLGDAQKIFGLKNDVPTLVTPSTWQGEYKFHEVLSNPSKFNLTPEQTAFVDGYRALRAEETAMRKAFDLPAKINTADEIYVPKHARGVTNQRNPLTGEVERLAKGEKPRPGWEVTTEVPTGRMTGKPEIHPSQVAGEARGVQYDTAMESIAKQLSETYQQAAWKELTDHATTLARARNLGTTPLERIPSGLRKLTQGVGRQVSDLKYVERQVADAVANKRLSGATLAAIERRYPEVAAKLREVLHMPMPNVERGVKAVSKETWEYVENNRTALVKAGKAEVRAGAKAIKGAARNTADEFMAAVKQARKERVIASLQKGVATGERQPGAAGATLAGLKAAGPATAQYGQLGKELTDMITKADGPIRPIDIQSAISRMNLTREAGDKLAAELYEKTGAWRMTQASDISATALSRLKSVEKAKQSGIFDTLEAAQKARTQALKDIRAQVKGELEAAKKELSPLSQEYQHELRKAAYEEVGTEIKIGGQIYPADIGIPLEKIYKDNVNETLRAIEKGVEVLRMGESGFDLGVNFLHTLPTTLYRPKAWAKSVAHSIAGLWDTGDMGKYMRGNRSLVGELKQGGVGFGPAEMAAAGGKGGLLEKIPVVGFGARHFESSFSSALTVAKVELWKSLRSKCLVNGVLDPEKTARYMAFIKNMTGTLETKQLGIRANQRAFENVGLMYASRYTRAGFALMDDAIRGGVTRKQSLMALGSFAVASSAMYIALCKATGQEPQLDPSQPGKFMTLKVGNTRVGVGGFHSAMLRFMVGAAADPGTIINTDDWQDSQVVKFVRGRTSIPVSIGWDVLSRQTYMGEPIEDMGDFAKEEVARRLLPFWISDYAMPSGAQPGAVEPITQFFGLRSFARSYSEVRNEMRDQYARSDFGGGWDELTKLQQKKLVSDHPDLGEMTELAAVQYSERGGPNAKQWREYTQETDRIDAEVQAKLAKVSAGYSAGLYTGKEFRQAVDEIYGQSRFAKEMLGKDDRYSSVFAYFNDPNKDTSDLQVEDIAYSDYCTQVYAGDLTDEFGRYNYEEANRRKQGIAQKYGPDAYQYIQEMLAFGKSSTPEVDQLRQARETLKPYWQIEDKAWAMYPQWKDKNDEIRVLESTDPDQAKRILKRYPQIVAIRKRIALEKKRMKATNPLVAQALIFYR